MKLLVVIQARMGSSRLPGKVLLPLAERPALQRMIERVRAAETPFQLCVATTGAAADRSIRELCKRLRVPVVEGHATDLLDRHYRAACLFGADVVAKIPSDCPLIDPNAVDSVVAAFVARGSDGCDYASNLWPPSWPDGNDVEVMSMRVLERAWKEATTHFDREHTTPYIWRNRADFRVANACHASGQDYSKTHRLTLDYPEDYVLIESIYAALWSSNRPLFGLADILAHLDEYPELRQLNARYHGQTYASSHDGRDEAGTPRRVAHEFTNRKSAS